MHRLRRLKRRLAESVGVSRYSRPSLEGVEDSLRPWLNFDRGIFVEAGANDGYTQSNTYYLERIRRWRGLLVEPVPRLWSECVLERPASVCENCALVSPAKHGRQLELVDVGLMTLARPGAGADEAAFARRVETASKVVNQAPTPFTAMGCTLSSLLDKHGFTHIDFLSLDLEGYEVEALLGLDLTRHAPSVILVENWNPDELDAMLCDRYHSLGMLTQRDRLYVHRGHTRA